MGKAEQSKKFYKHLIDNTKWPHRDWAIQEYKSNGENFTPETVLERSKHLNLFMRVPIREAVRNYLNSSLSQVGV